jgi:MFS transporter, FSR family, fosmidomycin resistance protein
VRQLFGNKALLALMLGHFTNDLFGGVLVMLYPVMKVAFGLTYAEIGLVTLAYSTMSSLTQPLFGHITDRGFRRWHAPLAVLWGSVFVSLYGFAPTFAAFIAFAALAGAASGAYHPLGATNAAAIIDVGARNRAMSLYTVAGTCGYAIGPLAATALLTLFGPRGTGVLIAPGVIVSALLLRRMRLVERVRAARAALATNAALARPAWGPLTRVIGVTMLRSWVALAVLQFIPLWYAALGYDRTFYGPLTTSMILAGAVGTLIGGNLADRIGQRRIVVASLTLLLPLVLLFAGFPGPIAFLTAPALSMASDSSLSVTLVMAQSLVPGRVGIASGMILGLGFITGGIGVPITGWVADQIGFQGAMLSLGVVGAAAALLALTIPSDARLAARMASAAPSVTPEPAVAGARR